MRAQYNNNNNSNNNYESDPRKVFIRKRTNCPLSEPGSPIIEYKNTKLLLKFISERGRILPSRITGVSPKKQRELKEAIKIARNIALLPFIQK
jgi:small subunit ribosomal protein S18